MNAIQKLYPSAVVKYEFINRGKTALPNGFAKALKEEVCAMADLKLSAKEEAFLREKCYYFDPVFIDLLKGYRYNPDEVHIQQTNGELTVEIEGYWYRTVLWEVPLLAIISELFYKMTGQKASCTKDNAKNKAKAFADIQAEYSEFGTRRRYSFDVQDCVINELKQYSESYLKGTSNVFMAMKHQLTPIGTHPHEWFMYHAIQSGYRMANISSLKAWFNVFQGDLGIALSDTFTTDNFFASFETKYAKLFDGVRWDSGDPLEFTDKVLKFYDQKKINPKSKTIVYSDALNFEKVRSIKEYVKGRIHDVYGIGTWLSNDVGVEPLNIVIKLAQAKPNEESVFFPTVKLSDVSGKYTGLQTEIEKCKKLLNINGNEEY